MSKTYNLMIISKKTIMSFMEKYQSKDEYEDFKKNKNLLENKIDEISQKSHGFFKKNRLYQSISLLMTNKFSIMDKYVNSSYFRRKYYELKYSSVEDMNEFKKHPLKKFSHKFLNFVSFKRIYSGKSTMDFIKASLMKIAIIYTSYLIIKLFYHKLLNRSVDKNLEETLRLFRELKSQNDEILKNNQMIIDENIRLKNKTISKL